MKIYEVSFHRVSNHPADDDSMTVWVQPSGLTALERESMKGATVRDVSFDVLLDWLSDFLHAPLEDDGDIGNAAFAVLYHYLERTHYYRADTVNSMMEYLLRSSRKTWEKVEE